MPDKSPLIGIALMILSTAFLAMKDGTAKTFIHLVNPVQAIWIQFVFTFLILAPIAYRTEGWKIFRPRPLAGQFARGAFNAAAVALLYWALTYIPLADAIAMFMFAPILVTVLSPILLGESLGPRRMAAAAVGFLGVIVILKPGFSGTPAGYYIAAASGLIMAGHYIANRFLATAQSPLLNITHNGLMGACALTPVLPFVWSTPPAEAVPGLTGLVILAILGQGLMITSFRFAPAVVVAPYVYCMLVFATLVGYVMFGTVPDTTTWLGISLIIAAGLYIAHRERQISIGARMPTHSTPPPRLP